MIKHKTFVRKKIDKQMFWYYNKNTVIRTNVPFKRFGKKPRHWRGKRISSFTPRDFEKDRAENQTEGVGCGPEGASRMDKQMRARSVRSREQEYLYGREARLRQIRESRRRKARRARILRMAGVLVIGLLLGIILSGFNRAPKAKVPVYKYYTSVTVGRDDTLWGIAREHITKEYSSMKKYMKEICELNNMRTDSVYYGQKLMLPYYSYEQKNGMF